MSSNNLKVTLAHAISFLTNPLLSSYTAATIIKLQAVLDANLTALYAPSWSVKEPLRGSGRRCLTLSPTCLPPRCIYSACIAAGIQWFDWIAALGGREFDFYVDPGCVAIRYSSPASGGVPAGQMITVWADEVVAPALPTPRTGITSFNLAQNAAIRKGLLDSKTVAQQLLEEDDEDQVLFNMIAHEVSGPTWVPPIITQFTDSTRSTSPLSSISGYSRCSSRSSTSSSSSLSYVGSDATSNGSPVSITSQHLVLPAAEPRQSRREKAKPARVFVDNTKKEVTPYDGGKTTVLTGGVMLGGGPKVSKPRKSTSPSSTANCWRSIRA